MAESATNSGKQAIAFWFHGRVQGVGFRHTAFTIAQHYPISGYVQNLPDGSVELIVEGQQAAIDRYIAHLGTIMAENILRTRWESRTPQGFDSFTIKR